nr:hypothetical protein [Streptomyces sp. ISL-98]
MRLLVQQLKATKAVAELLGIAQRTVERYVKGQITKLRTNLAARLTGEVRNRWQPRVQEKAKRNAEPPPASWRETRAGFGFTAAPGTTDDRRARLINQHFPPEYDPAVRGARRRCCMRTRVMDTPPTLAGCSCAGTAGPGLPESRLAHPVFRNQRHRPQIHHGDAIGMATNGRFSSRALPDAERGSSG